MRMFEFNIYSESMSWRLELYKTESLLFDSLQFLYSLTGKKGKIGYSGLTHLPFKDDATKRPRELLVLPARYCAHSLYFEAKVVYCIYLPSQYH